MLKEDIYERLNNEMLIKRDGGVYYLTQIKFAFNSNRIEGSTLNEEQTRYIYETKTIGQIDKNNIKINDIIETHNHFKCLDYIIKKGRKKLSENIIKEIHKILKSGTLDSEDVNFNVGGYKKLNNVVEGITTAKVEEVSEKMKTLVNNYNNIKKIGIDDIINFHYLFERIHPFQDGNGRVGRLVIFKECLKNNIIPFIIYNENKIEYYKGLKEYSSNKKPLKNICIYEQDKYKSILNYFSVKYDNWEKNPKVMTNRQIIETLYNDIHKNIKNLEGNKEIFNKVYMNGYYNEIKDANEKLYDFLNNGEIDKNYNDGIIELKALLKLKENDLKGKDDPLSKGKIKALIYLKFGIDNALRLMKCKNGCTNIVIT